MLDTKYIYIGGVDNYMKSIANLEPKVKVILAAHRKIGDVVIKIEEGEYYVEGQKGRKYMVKVDKVKNWSCDCPSFVYGSGVDPIDGSCKHVRVVRWMLDNKELIRDVHEVMKEEMESGS